MLPLFTSRCERCGAYYRRGRPACDCLRRARLWGGLTALLLAALLAGGVVAAWWWMALPTSPRVKPSDMPGYGLPPPPPPGTTKF
jgi:hypothetical protein